MTRRTALALLLVVTALVVGVVQANNKGVSELDVYTLAAERMRAGEEVYRLDEKAFTYPPAMALPFVPLVALPAAAHRTAFFLLNAAALAVVVLALRRLFGALREEVGAPPRTATWTWVVTLLLVGRHVTSPFENQSNDVLVLLCVGLAAWLLARRREALAGGAAGVGAALKATPLLFLPVLVVQRRWRAALALVLVAVLLTWLPDVLLPRDDGGSWALAWRETFLGGLAVGETAQAEGAWSSWNHLNQNLAGTLYRLGTRVTEATDHAWDVSLLDLGPGALKAVTVLGQLAVLAAVAACTWPGLAGEERGARLAFRRLGEVGAIGCGMVLLSPMSSKAHFCVLLLGVFFVVAHQRLVFRDRLQAALLVLVFATGTLTSKGLVGRELGNELLARGVVCWSTLLLLACVARALRRGFEEAPA